MPYDFEVLKSLAAMSKYDLGDDYLDRLFHFDGSAVYYRFVYRIAAYYKPMTIVELGVLSGRSAAHWAAPLKDLPMGKGTVFAVDPDPLPEFKETLKRYPNIVPILSYSDNKWVLDMFDDGTVDICFIDTIHEYEQASKEMRLWTPKMAPGGLFLCDDISLSDGMKRFWNEVPFEKVSLPELHFSGFGVAKVSG